MKKFYFSLFALLLGLVTLAQVPEGFKYQAVIRDGSGEIRADSDVEIDISVLQGSESGTSVYMETHNVTTNNHGLISLNIGEGSTGDTFGAIDWADGPYYLKISVDGSEMGTSQILSVPYAMYAEKSGNAFSGNYEDLVNAPDLSDTASYLTQEQDPAFMESAAAGINAGDTAQWNKNNRKWSLKANDDLYYDKGMVGIGTDTPTSDLMIQGTGKPYEIMLRDNYAFMGLDGTQNSGIRLFTDGTPKTYLYYNGHSDYFRIYNAVSGYGLVLNNQNNVGVNTINPQTELHVNGSARIEETTDSPEPKTLYGNSAPLAYGILQYNSILSGYNIASVERTSTGHYTITLNNGWSGHPAVIVTCYNSYSKVEVPTYHAAENSNKVYVIISDASGTGISSAFSIVVFGMPQ